MLIYVSVYWKLSILFQEICSMLKALIKEEVFIIYFSLISFSKGKTFSKLRKFSEIDAIASKKNDLKIVFRFPLSAFRCLVPTQTANNLLIELLLGVVESLHALRTTNCSLGFDAAKTIFTIENSHKSQAGQVDKLCTTMLTSDSLSCSHNSIILRFNITFTMQRYGAILTTLVKIENNW